MTRGNDDRVLYRVIIEQRYNGGARCDVRQGTAEVLYCGYSRLEAARVYHAATPTVQGGAAPGQYYRRVLAQKKQILASDRQQSAPVI